MTPVLGEKGEKGETGGGRPDLLDQAVLLLVNGWSLADAERFCQTRGQSPAAAKRTAAEARKRLTLAAEFSRDELLGTALTRLNKLYADCVKAKDLGKALGVQREINRLADLYAMGGGGDSGGGPTSDADAQDAMEELDAVAQHLLPLGLARAEYPLREHARLAAELVCRMRRAGEPPKSEKSEKPVTMDAETKQP